MYVDAIKEGLAERKAGKEKAKEEKAVAAKEVKEEVTTENK